MENVKSRKELKQEYKEAKSVMGVFKIENKTNGKLLIEASTDVHSKWNRHCTELRFGSHRNRELQADWTAQGQDGFEFTVLSELEQDDKVGVDYNKELKVLKEMVVSDLGLDAGLFY